ncbi:MAG: ABC transporter permease subunit [Acidobacteriia bacterium]|nr:ABC transporter permease subunit [Terriglobia bacterium]
MAFDWTGVWLATAGSLLLGVGIAYLLSQRIWLRGWPIVAALVVFLVVPTVILTGLRWRGFLTPAGVVAGLPFVALITGSRFRNLNQDYGSVARSLGASEWRIFWRLLAPQAWRWIAIATVIAWVRIVTEWAIASGL